MNHCVFACIYTHTRVYLATNLFLTFIFKNWCLYMKHLGHCTSRAFIKVIKWLFGGLRKRGEDNILQKYVAKSKVCETGLGS